MKIYELIKKCGEWTVKPHMIKVLPCDAEVNSFSHDGYPIYYSHSTDCNYLVKQ